MASGIYIKFKDNLFKKTTDMDSDTLKVCLLSSGHSFTATQQNYEAISANEITGTGYTAGGVAMTGLVITSGATTYFDAGDTSWASATFTASHCAIYDTTVNNELICSIDFGAGKEVSSGTFTIQWNASGIISIT